MSESRPRKVLLIGTGRAGTGVGLFLREGGAEVAFVSRTRRGFLGGMPAIPVGDTAPFGQPDFVLVAVPDRFIVSSLESAWRPEWSLAAVGHLSGALPATVLSGRVAPDRAFCAHPLYSFPAQERLEPMPRGTLVTLEGRDGPVQAARELFESCGAMVSRLDASRKPLYHAAAVLCANLSVALVHGGAELLDRAGLDSPLDAALALAGSAMRNLASARGISGVTGPVARGDVATVRSNLTALRGLGSSWVDAYVACSHLLLELLAPSRLPGREESVEILRVLRAAMNEAER